MKQRTLPPGPRRVFALKSLRAIRRDPLSFFQSLRREYGRIAHVRIWGRDLVLLSDPERIERVVITEADRFTKSRALQMTKPLLGEGLLTSEGRFHLQQRRMIAPVFRRPRMADYAAVMTDWADRWSRRWQPQQPVEMSRQMMGLTLCIAGETLFGADLGDDVERVGEALDVTRSMFPRTLLPFASLIGRLPLPSNRRYHRALAQLDEVVYRLIDQGRAGQTQQRGDLLSRLLEARDDSGAGMSDKQIRDEALTLLLAGHETTAAALTWTWQLLSDHPEVERKLHEELDSVLGGRPATFEDLESLPYTRQVLTESMRLRPPAYAIGRSPKEDHQLGEHLIPQGAQLLMSQYVIHRDEAYYEDPEAFRPERWTPEFAHSLPRFAYFPFGGGPRTCIGEGFAWTEGMIVLATLAQRWAPRLAADQLVEPEPMVTLRPKHGMRMTLHPRSSRVPA